MAQYDLLLTQNVAATGIEYQERFVNVAKGGLLSASGTNVPAVLTGGTDGYILSRDDAETTGLKWIDPVSGSLWTDNTTYLSPPTGYSVRLSTTEQLQFTDTTKYIVGPTGYIDVYNAGHVFRFAQLTGTHVTYNDILAGGTGLDLGGTAQPFNSMASDRYYVAVIGTYIDVSGTDMTFTSVAAGTVNLADLAAGTSPWTTDTYGVTYDLNVGIGAASHSTYQLYTVGTTYLSGRVIVGNGTPGADGEVLNLNTERPWGFFQGFTGASSTMNFCDRGGSKNFFIRGYNATPTSGNAIAGFMGAVGSERVKLYFSGSERLATVTGGVEVYGDLTVSNQMKANGYWQIIDLPGMQMGSGGITDEYLVLCRKWITGTGFPAYGFNGAIHFQRGGTGSGNAISKINLTIQSAYSNNYFGKFEVEGYEVYTSIDEITISGVVYYALKARTSGGGEYYTHQWVGDHYNQDSDANILTRVVLSDVNVALVTANVVLPDKIAADAHVIAGDLHVSDSITIVGASDLQGDVSLNYLGARINLGSGSVNGPHGIYFYDAVGTVGIQQVYRTTPETLYWEDSTDADLMSLDKSGILTVSTGITIAGIPLTEASYRPGVLSVGRDGSSSMSGVTLNFSATAQWSYMGDETRVGVYDDYANEWAWQYTENGAIQLYHNAAVKLATTSTGITVTGTGVATDWTGSSDVSLKTNITRYGSVLDGVMELYKSPYGLSLYNRWVLDENGDPTTKHESVEEIGMIAQEMKGIFPHIVSGSEEERYSISYMRLAAIAVTGVAELKTEKDKEIDALQKRVQVLEQEVDILKN